MLSITTIYAAIIALLFLALSFRVITYRRGNLISLGDHGDKALETRIRAQGNCAEYAPIGLILLGLVELNGAAPIIIHLLGLMLLAGRLMHGIGFWGDRPVMLLRVWGMLLTTGMIGLSAFGLLVLSLL